MIKQAVILAGGKGTRLKERLGDLPKPLIDLCGMPLLERQIIWLKKFGVNNILILVSYQSNKIIQFCSSKYNWGIEINFGIDEQPRGTAGAVLNAWDQLSEEFLVVYGDTMPNVDLYKFYTYHRSSQNVAATIFVHPNDHPHDSDLIATDQSGFITKFHPHPHNENIYLQNLVNAALYIIKKSGLEDFKKINHQTLDFGKDLFNMMINIDLKLRAYNSPEYIKDCGTPDRIDKVSKDFLSGKIEKSSLIYPQKAIFLDRDGTINIERGYISSIDDFHLISGVELAIKKINESEYKACVVTNQPVISRGECSEEMLKKIHNKMDTLLAKSSAYIDAIEYCPHHPESGYEGEISELKRECRCRKPQIGMIENIVQKFNINLSESWMIGDATSDIRMAKNAGIKSILVQTGYSGEDEKYPDAPDFLFPNLETAVDFILCNYPQSMSMAHQLVKNIQPGNFLCISGKECSGKSSIASLFKYALIEKGFEVIVISIKQLDYFPDGDNIEINKGYVKNIEPYLSEINKDNGKILIFDGVFLPKTVDNDKIINYFVDIDESIRKQRLLNKYSFKKYKLMHSDMRLQEKIYYGDFFCKKNNLNVNLINNLF